MKSIRWDGKQQCFVSGDISSHGRDGFAIESALDISLSSLRRALARQAGVSVPPVRFLPSPKPYKDYSEFSKSVLGGFHGEIVFESNESQSNMLFFCLTQQGHLHAHFRVENSVISDKGTVVAITNRIFGKPYDLIQLLTHSVDPDDEGPFWSYEIACDSTGRTVGSIWQGYKTLCFLLTTSPEDLLRSAKGVQLALRLGRPDVLIGTPESSWLDVKSTDYLLSSPAEKIKLALDVARFANADGGLLVLGLRTSQSHGVDIISRVTPLPMPARQVARYRNIIDTHVYPLVRGLDVFSVPRDRGELLVISIPSQLEDNKPFVVHGNLGSITDNKVKGLFVSVVQRRGDGAEYLSGPAIHALFSTRRMQSGG
jgi:hypothetical protein